MWDLPRPGLEPVSSALAGGFLTTVPPGKSLKTFWCQFYFQEQGCWDKLRINSYIDEVCLVPSIRARISLTIDTLCGQGFGPSLDRYVEALISRTEGLAAGLATGFINLTQDPAILRME